MKDAGMLNTIHNKLGDDTLSIKRKEGVWQVTIHKVDEEVVARRTSFRDALGSAVSYLKQN